MTLSRLHARAVALAIAVIVAVPLVTALTPNVAAPAAGAAPVATAAAPSFDPGNIISDAVFYNGNAMNESAVEAFLRSQVTSCVPGYTCLKDFRANTWTRSGDAQCNTYNGASNESSARIIVKVAQACGINPQALIVMLQKEQGLVTSRAPSSWAWSASMGYACPDTAPCATEYFGFYNQVYMAAWQLKRYGNSSYFNWFPVGGVANVRFHPNVACGSTPVYIANRATAALYYYTPYQPNAAALAAGYGTSADACSSYGNRNFFNYFRDWFGDPAGSAIAQIDAKRASASWLGQPTGSHNSIAGGYVRGYENGAITWTPSAGAVIISNTFRPRFAESGGVVGELGWPVTDAVFVGSRVWTQEFQHGALSQTPSTAVVMINAIDWFVYTVTYGAENGPMGLPTGERSCSSGTCRQPFENASMVYTSTTRGVEVPAIASYELSVAGASLGTPSGFATVRVAGNGFVRGYANGAVVSSPSGVFAVSGSIRATFGSAGGLDGFLGWPISAVGCVGDLCTQQFADGRIERRGTSTPVALSSGIVATYDALGGRGGILGAPLGSTSVRVGGHVTAFEGGAITWTSSAGGIMVAEPVRTPYGTTGGLVGPLGWPVTNARSEAANGGGVVQGFADGALTVTAAGAFTLSGQIRNGFGDRGGLAGWLGWPVSNARVVVAGSEGSVQGFMGGALVYRPSSGVLAVSGDIRERFGVAGGIVGPVGWPTSDPRQVTTSAGEGLVQGFEQGAIVFREETGAILLATGPVRTAFNDSGGLGGDLGWPASELECSSDGSCIQAFTGGQISLSAAGTVTVVRD